MATAIESELEGARGARRTAALLFVFLLGLFALSAQPGVFNPDAEVEFQTARSLLLRGHAGLSAEHPDASSAEIGIVNFVPGPGRTGFDVMRGVDGLDYSWFGIGHALVMLPFVAAGRAMSEAFPETETEALEAALREAREVGASEAFARAFHEDFFAHAFVGFHSALFAAGIGLLVYLLLGHLGYARRARLWATLLACVTTQLWPGARECMSDVTANFFLLLSVERVLAWALSGARRRSLVLAGAAGGFSVMCRYGQVVPLFALGVYLVYVARTRRLGAKARPIERKGEGGDARPRWGDVASFALAALPFGLAVLAFNYYRFGDVRTTGYEAGTADGYWKFPIHLGLLFLLASPGKGALVFSPLLAAAPGGFLTALRARRAELVMIAAVFVLPWLLASRMTGWHASQSWAVRYMTLGTVLVIAVGLAASFTRGLRSKWTQRAVLACALLGFTINLGGIVTPYRGYYDLGRSAWAERWSEIDPREDLFQRAVLMPRLSPAIGHWLYALESARGRLPATESAEAEPVWRSVYGVVPRDAKGAVLPQRLQFVEDRDFGHLWWTAWPRRFGSAKPWVCAAILALITLLAGVLLVRVTPRDPTSPA